MKRRRSTLAVAIYLFVSGATGAETEAVAELDRDTPQFTSIARQELSHALLALAKERNVQLIYRSELVNDQTTEGVHGVLTIDEVLTQLLVGTGLNYRYIAKNAVIIGPQR